MATTFQSMNLSLGPRDAHPNPTTAEPPVALGSPMHSPVHDETGSVVPPSARVSFAETKGKRALPISPQSSTFPPAPLSTGSDERARSAEASSGSRAGKREDAGAASDDDGSDTESAEGDENGRPSKKKKGQRFFCTDYPPCNLSFTRSEHLARHIRKHTGERPFQCHCARRFSRLDNLRQHAQTVHVNEDIPGDSLAATGTRFQRQIRTDRVRPQGRARASTAGSQGGHIRGHGRNLSTSSIASTSSTLSTLSNLSSLGHETPGRRPPPLMMADHSPRTRLTIDTVTASPHSAYPTYGRQSPTGDPTTPTSITYSNTPSSPFHSTLGSPLGVARHGSWSERGHARRLSVPSTTNPFQPASGGGPSPGFQPSMHGPGHSRTSSTNSIVASPTSSIHSFVRHESGTDGDWRRRTWHPSTYPNYAYHRPATSGLAFHQTPDAPRPAFAPQPPPAAAAAAGPSQRLPGIETFDQISQRPVTPPRNSGATGQADSMRVPTFPGAGDRGNLHGAPDRRGHLSWDLSLHQNLTKLDIANGTPPRDATVGSWGHSTAMNTSPDRPVHAQPGPAVPPQPPARTHAPAPPTLASQASQETIRSPTQTFDAARADADPGAANRTKRQGWYHAPPYSLPHVLRPAAAPQRTSSEDTSSSEGVPTPITASVDYQPSIIHANGYIEPQPAAASSFTSFVPHPPAAAPPHLHPSHPPAQPPVPYDPSRPPPPPPAKNSHAMTGLEALVAAATSEDKARNGGPR